MKLAKRVGVSEPSSPDVRHAGPVLRPALPANGNLDGDGLPIVSRLAVLSSIHCSAGFALNTSEVDLSYIYHTSSRGSATLVMFQAEEGAREEEEEEEGCRVKVEG